MNKNITVSYSPITNTHFFATECKKADTACNRFILALHEFFGSITHQVNFTFFCRETFTSDNYKYRLGCNYRKTYVSGAFCISYGYGIRFSFDLTLHDDVYILGVRTMTFDIDRNFVDNSEDTSDTSEDTSEDTSDTSEDTSDTSEDTSDTSEDTSDTSEDTSDTSEDTSFALVPRWFYQRANIYIWSAVLSAFNAVCCAGDRRKRVIVKPVRISPRQCFPVRISPYGMPADYYPYKMIADGLEVWDCRSWVYNMHLADLIGAPPDYELPF